MTDNEFNKFIDMLISDYTELLKKDKFEELFKEWCNELDSLDGVDNNISGMFAVLYKVIPECIEGIGHDTWACFTYGNPYLESFEVPKGTKELYHTFCECTNLKKVKLPEGLEAIGESSFDSCTSLSDINIPKSVDYIGDIAFWGCRSLPDITLPEKLTRIGESAFGSCESFTHIVIPPRVELIYSLAFNGCTNLEYVEITGDTEISGKDTFEHCPKLTIYTDSEDVIDYCQSYKYNYKKI